MMNRAAIPTPNARNKKKEGYVPPPQTTFEFEYALY
jgi:hypothetical protein